MMIVMQVPGEVLITSVTRFFPYLVLPQTGHHNPRSFSIQGPVMLGGIGVRCTRAKTATRRCWFAGSGAATRPATEGVRKESHRIQPAQWFAFHHCGTP